MDIERSPAVVLFFTGSVQGYLDLCGCPTFPLGGLDRRRGYIRSIERLWPRASTLLLDSGNFAESPGRSGDIKTQGLVEGMNRMGYAVSGIGERELFGGVEWFESMTAEADFPLITANIVRASDGRPWRARNAILETAGMSFGIVAATAFNPTARWELPDGDHLRIVEPTDPVRETVEAMQEKVDVVVLLASMPVEDARHLVSEVKGIDLVLGAHSALATAEPIRIDSTTVLYAGDQGRFVVQLEVYPREGMKPEFMATLVPLSEKVEVDEEMGAFAFDVLARADQAEVEKRLALSEVRSEEVTYMGPGACAGCHGDILKTWSKSGHARSYELLALQQGGYKPECIRCHVTAYNEPGGFVDLDLTPHLKAVSCEACHGPAGEHVKSPEAPYGEVKVKSCTICHTAEQDAEFDFYRDKARVSHSGAAP